MDKYIKELLELYSKIILPGFGAIVIEDAINKNLMFNAFLNYDDGKLAQLIEANSSMDEQAAKNAVSKYIREVQQQLDKGETYEIYQLGTFSKNDDGEYVFVGNLNKVEAKTSNKVAKKENMPPKTIKDSDQTNTSSIDNTAKDKDKDVSAKKIDTNDKKKAKAAQKKEAQLKKEAFKKEKAEEKAKMKAEKLAKKKELRAEKEKIKLDKIAKKKAKNEAKTAPKNEKKVENIETKGAQKPKPKEKDAANKKAKVIVTTPILTSEKEVKTSGKKENTYTEKPKNKEAVPPSKSEGNTKQQSQEKDKEVTTKEKDKEVTTKEKVDSKHRKPEESKKKKRSLLWVFLILGLIIIALLVYLFLNYKEISNYMGWNTIKKTEQPKTQSEKQIAPKEKPHSEEQEMDKTPKKEVTANPTKDLSNLHFHIVAGCFEEISNANRFIEKLKSKGYSDARIVGKRGTLNEVALGSYASMEEAQITLNKIRASHPAAWIDKQ